jgi:hypothetical protein
MTESMIRDWCRVGAEEIASNLNSPAVQTAEVMQAQMHDKLSHLHKVAEQLYRHWLQGIAA